MHQNEVYWTTSSTWVSGVSLEREIQMSLSLPLGHAGEAVVRVDHLEQEGRNDTTFRFYKVTDLPSPGFTSLFQLFIHYFKLFEPFVHYC